MVAAGLLMAPFSAALLSGVDGSGAYNPIIVAPSDIPAHQEHPPERTFTIVNVASNGTIAATSSAVTFQTSSGFVWTYLAREKDS